MYPVLSESNSSPDKMTKTDSLLKRSLPHFIMIGNEMVARMHNSLPSNRISSASRQEKEWIITKLTIPTDSRTSRKGQVPGELQLR